MDFIIKESDTGKQIRFHDVHPD